MCHFLYENKYKQKYASMFNGRSKIIEHMTMNCKVIIIKIYVSHHYTECVIFLYENDYKQKYASMFNGRSKMFELMTLDGNAVAGACNFTLVI